MTDLLGILAVGALFAAGVLVGRALLRTVRLPRGIRFRTEPVPEDWYAILDRAGPAARLLTSEERERLLRLVQVFVHEKHFEGAEGLVVTDEMRVTIAAHACLLLLHLDGPCYPHLKTVLIYPGTFVPKRPRLGGAPTGLLVEPPRPLLGESWQDGVVVLSWDSVRAGAMNAADRGNVVLHEFAHQLDQEDGVADGTPILDTPSSLRTWAYVLGRRFEELREESEYDTRTVLNSYATANKAEFFAVATEAFFDEPVALRARYPDLYEQLTRFYHQDPAARVGQLGS